MGSLLDEQRLGLIPNCKVLGGLGLAIAAAAVAAADIAPSS